MRIISQFGQDDLEYERCYVWESENEIYCNTNDRPDKDILLAYYSTPEKAEKAMQFLHEAYIVHENFKKVDAELQLKMLGAVEKETRLKYGGIFRFPKEEDL